MKKFLLLSLSLLFTIMFTSCMKDPEPVDTFNKKEWEKDVTEELEEVQLTNGTWKFRRYESYKKHSEHDEYWYGEFVITNNANDLDNDIQFTKLTNIVKVNKPFYPKHFKWVLKEEELKGGISVWDSFDHLSVNHNIANVINCAIQGNTENTKFKTTFVYSTGFDDEDDIETIVSYFEKIEGQN